MTPTSQLFSHRKRGTSIVEMMAGLTIASVSLILLVWLVNSLLRSKYSPDSQLFVQRVQMEEIQLALLRAARDAERVIVRTGSLHDSTGTYSGRLVKVPNLHEFSPNDDDALLSAMELSIVPNSDPHVIDDTVLIVGKKVTALIKSQQSDPTTGINVVSVRYFDDGLLRSARFQFRTSDAAPLDDRVMRGIFGRFGKIDGGKAFSVTLPNPQYFSTHKANLPLPSMNTHPDFLVAPAPAILQ